MSDIRFNQWLHQSGTGGVSQVASGAVGVGTTNPLADFYVRGDAQITGILTAGHIAMGSSITFGDDDRAYFGDGTDLQIYHSGSDSFIQDTGTGDLKIRSSNVRIEDTSGNLIINAAPTTAFLYASGNAKLGTAGWGAQVNGIFKVLDATDSSGSTNKLSIGTGNDFNLYHDNNGDSYISNTTGHLTIRNNTSGRIINLQPKSGANGVITRYEGASELYYNGNKKFETTNTGGTVTGSLLTTGNISINNVAPKIFLTDSDTDSDFAIRNMHGVFGIHDSTNSADRLIITSGGLIGIGTATIRNSRAMQLTGASNSLFLITGHAPSVCLNRDADDSSDSDRSFFGVSSVSNGFANGTAAGDTIVRGNSSGKIHLATGTSIRMSIEPGGETNFNSNVTISGDLTIPDKIIHTGDTNTAIRFPANDTITFETAGSERLRIHSSGRVGINTTTDSMDGVTGNLNIANTNFNNHTVINLSRNTAADRPQIRFQNTNGNIGSIDTFGSDLLISSGNGLTFRTNSNTRLSITSTGALQHTPTSGVNYFTGTGEYVFGSQYSSPPSGGNEANFQIHTHKTRASFSINAYMNNAGAPFMQFLSSRSGTVGVLGTKSLINDYIGDIRFVGDNGTNYNSVCNVGQITVRQKSSMSDGDTTAAGELSVFLGDPDGGSVSEKVRVHASGNTQLYTGDLLLGPDSVSQMEATIRAWGCSLWFTTIDSNYYHDSGGEFRQFYNKGSFRGDNYLTAFDCPIQTGVGPQNRNFWRGAVAGTRAEGSLDISVGYRGAWFFIGQTSCASIPYQGSGRYLFDRNNARTSVSFDSFGSSIDSGELSFHAGSTAGYDSGNGTVGGRLGSSNSDSTLRMYCVGVNMENYNAPNSKRAGNHLGISVINDDGTDYGSSRLSENLINNSTTGGTNSATGEFNWGNRHSNDRGGTTTFRHSQLMYFDDVQLNSAQWDYLEHYFKVMYG